jgi:F-type H+-transporting ATPase subunit epsilon
MDTIQVDIVSAEGQIFSGPATMVFLPASEGEIGVTPRHAPLLTLLKAGEVRVRTPEGEEHWFYVGGGALEVQPKKVTVLARYRGTGQGPRRGPPRPAARQRAESVLSGQIDKLTQAEALAELAQAMAQLKMIQKLRKLKG